MKKISMIALTILTLGVTSCDMDKMPYDAVPTEEALTTIVGFEEARAGIYSVYLGSMCMRGKRILQEHTATFI